VTDTPGAKPRYWHKTDLDLDPGCLTQPGRWGTKVTQLGAMHPFFYRENLLDLWRRVRTQITVSRFNCTYAFEDRAVAEEFRATVSAARQEHVYMVEPVSIFPCHRADALWLTWMGEPGRMPDQVLGDCGSYWMGRSTEDLADYATSQWEWLFSAPLKVLKNVD
jgi:hypothetical protein